MLTKRNLLRFEVLNLLTCLKGKHLDELVYHLSIWNGGWKKQQEVISVLEDPTRSPPGVIEVKDPSSLEEFKTRMREGLPIN